MSYSSELRYLVILILLREIAEASLRSIEEIIKVREVFRANKLYGQADLIRDNLAKMGIELNDLC